MFFLIPKEYFFLIGKHYLRKYYFINSKYNKKYKKCDIIKKFHIKIFDTKEKAIDDTIENST